MRKLCDMRFFLNGADVREAVKSRRFVLAFLSQFVDSAGSIPVQSGRAVTTVWNRLCGVDSWIPAFRR